MFVLCLQLGKDIMQAKPEELSPKKGDLLTTHQHFFFTSAVVFHLTISMVFNWAVSNY